MPEGYVVLVLHSHLPYVLSHGKWPYGSDWLCEAASETYIPLLNLVGFVSGARTVSPLHRGHHSGPLRDAGFPPLQVRAEGIHRGENTGGDLRPAVLQGPDTGRYGRAGRAMARLLRVAPRRFHGPLRRGPARRLQAISGRRADRDHRLGRHPRLFAPPGSGQRRQRPDRARHRQPTESTFPGNRPECGFPSAPTGRRRRRMPGTRPRPGLEVFLAAHGLKYFFVDGRHLLRQPEDPRSYAVGVGARPRAPEGRRVGSYPKASIGATGSSAWNVGGRARARKGRPRRKRPLSVHAIYRDGRGPAGMRRSSSATRRRASRCGAPALATPETLTTWNSTKSGTLGA